MKKFLSKNLPKNILKFTTQFEFTKKKFLCIIGEVSKRQAVATPPDGNEGGLAFPEENIRKEVRCMRFMKIVIRVIAITGVIMVLCTKVAA